jgi:hypothetical protein
MLHNNGCLHTAAQTVKSLHQLKIELLKHLLYSPDLAPDYHLFGPLKDALRSPHFASDQEVKKVVHAWLVTQPRTFFSEGIQNLVDHWTKCVEKDEDCT